MLPALEGAETWDSMADRVRREHDQIRGMAQRLATLDDAHELGQLLNDHVRFEERQSFEDLEARLDPDRLERLGREIELAG